jgi:D-alanyl-lipoteichoic acid acyltransferase DltB (MBOAT superfamily)
MTFHSFQYLVFLPLIVAIHFAVPHRVRWFVLLVGSYLFYCAWRVDFALLLILSTVTDYVAGLRLEATADPRLRKTILGFSLTINLGLLFFFKYVPTLWDMLRGLAVSMGGGDASAYPALDILLPLGISFYTFQTLSYTIDIYRRRIPAERHFGFFALYVAFFPQLLAGPIERAGHLLKELRAENRFNAAWVGPALTLILLGLAKKLVIADRLGNIFEPVIREPLSHSPLEVLMTPVATVYQYYCDLSGYADMAIGSAMLLGVQLSRNFDRPFAATSTMRFWYQWHITVTAWFRDYLLRPLVRGGSVAASRVLPLMITGLVIGLWHGPTLGWAIAGCSVGLLAIPESRWTRWRIRNGIKPQGAVQRTLWDWGGRLYVWTIVFFLIGLPLTWGDIGTLGQVISHIATMGSNHSGAALSIMSAGGFRVPLVLAAIVTLELWQWLEARGLTTRAIGALPLEFRWLLATASAVVIANLADRTQSGFLYFKF